MTTTDGELLDGWADESRGLLGERLLKQGSAGRLSADDASELARIERAAIERVMLKLLPVARGFSRPPVSNYRVGAVALGAGGALYLGANIEFSGAALNQTVHAEQSAIANAFAHEERGIEAIAVTAPPCGHCRQFINEISEAARIRIIVEGQPPRALGDLLPASFGPLDLGIAGGMFGVEPVTMRLAEGEDDPPVRAALEAASRAYAPHTKSRSGCAISTESGRIYSGSYMENAAFNPSLSPLQSAIVAVVLAGEDLRTIRSVVLVEEERAVISQLAATEAVLGAVCPKAQLKRVVAAS